MPFAAHINGVMSFVLFDVAWACCCLCRLTSSGSVAWRSRWALPPTARAMPVRLRRRMWVMQRLLWMLRMAS